MKKLYILLLAGLSAASAVAAVPAHKNVPMKTPHKVATVPTPQVLPATDITEEGFTANWKAVPGAETYQVSVYEPITVGSDGEYIVLSENFNLVSQGSTNDPYFPDESFVNLSDYDWTYTPDWQGFWPVFAKGMVGGIIYSPYIDLTHNNGTFTVRFSVVGQSGAQVHLISEGTDSDERVFTLTTNGSNEFTATFTNGCHDTYLRYVDYGIPNDPDGDYAGVYAFLDDIDVIQELKATETFLRLVQTEETYRTSYMFLTLPYRYGALNLAYDVQANVVEYNDPDDPWDYDVYRSEYSDLEYVTLRESGGDDPNPDDPDDPDDPNVEPDGDGFCLYVGEYKDSTKADIEDGTWWDRAPFQWYTANSASQIIYTAEDLKGLKKGDVIKSLTFKYQDQGSFTNVMAELNLYVGNAECTEFTVKPDTEKYLWQTYDETTPYQAYQVYEADLYYQQEEEIVFTLDQPMEYDGNSIVVTAVSQNLGNEVQGVASVCKRTTERQTMCFGSDTETWANVYASTFNYPYMTPNKWVPVVKVSFDRSDAIDSVTAVEEEGAAEYFNLQGVRVINPSAGLYIRRTANGAEKVYVK